MTTLGATSLLPLECGDDASDLEQKFEAWKAAIVSILVDPDDTPDGSSKKMKLKAYRKQNRAEEEAAAEEDEEEEEDRINDMYVIASDTEDEDVFGPRPNKKAIEVGDDDHGAVVDVEDMGPVMKRSDEERKTTAVAREMVTKLQRKALTKEGYKIIGSHSAVKLCRWTKNQMRGRGGCYKHTCYGITSYQCMEATPSLACANKCVFCWRHHKNPVGTEWRWKTDEPKMIVEQAISEHRKMINQMRGVSGVQPERLKEAMTVKHCALSLVGEPIMYPHINEMLQELHNRSISTFLVTNGQFPECIDVLDPVTQLYVSVDAPTRDSLKAVDRPLFKDFWERYIASLKALGRKQQRTVYRLTLVKDYNMQDVDGYVELIEIGQPDFIEIKAMTYCGKSDASDLTMQNVPWHKEVCEYAELISRRLAERGISVPFSIASEHEHSCLVLMAREDKFKLDGVWHTWIDYPKFDALMQEYYASGKTATFTSTDYMLQTPDWALYQSKERGFDPKEQRWRRNASGATVENAYKPSASGCG
jgi:tRNA wybutosine-synthesizing protein 1